MIIKNNAELLLDMENPMKYLDCANKSFEESFGGPSVYFHRRSIEEGKISFLSDKHLEYIYATLASWGMHRMGDTKAKLHEWSKFRDSILKYEPIFSKLRPTKLDQIDLNQYNVILRNIESAFMGMEVSISNQKIVANSKTLYHILPDLIPPIDRQYTIRFFTKTQGKWLESNGRFRHINLPTNPDKQFELFVNLCREMKGLADGLAPHMSKQKRSGVTLPKSIDNVIIYFIRTEKPKNR